MILSGVTDSHPLSARLDKTRYLHIRRRKVPLAEIYSPISTALQVAQLDEIESWGAVVTPAFSGPEVGELAILPAP